MANIILNPNCKKHWIMTNSYDDTKFDPEEQLLLFLVEYKPGKGYGFYCKNCKCNHDYLQAPEQNVVFVTTTSLTANAILV